MASRLWIALAVPAVIAAAEPQPKLSPFGTVERLSVLPLCELKSESSKFATEPGVSYLVRADGITILMDTGRNHGSEHPSPLLRNMQALAVDPARIGMLFFSHLHPDHLGGAREFSVSHGAVPLPAVAAFAPGPLKPSQWNPEPVVQVLTEPRVLAGGVASIGPQPGPGNLMEQALAVNLAGRGIVLLSGCGHQTVAAMVKRARELFTEPVYGVVGGLHLGEGGPAADQAMQALKALRPGVVAISPHDTSEGTLRRFQDEFGSRYREILVGRELVFEGAER